MGLVGRGVGGCKMIQPASLIPHTRWNPPHTHTPQQWHSPNWESDPNVHILKREMKWSKKLPQQREWSAGWKDWGRRRLKEVWVAEYLVSLEKLLLLFSGLLGNRVLWDSLKTLVFIFQIRLQNKGKEGPSSGNEKLPKWSKNHVSFRGIKVFTFVGVLTNTN